MDLSKPSPALRQSKIAARNEEKMQGRMARRAAAPATPAPPTGPEAGEPAPTTPAPVDAVSSGNQPWWWNPNRAGKTMGSGAPTAFGGAGTAGAAAGPGQQDTSMDSFWEWMRQNGYAR